MDSPQKPGEPVTKNSKNVLLAVMAGQVGFLTLAVVIIAVIGGLALDNLLGTKPWFTIGLLIVSIPISIFLMVLVARRTVARIKTEPSNTPHTKEEEIGKDS